MPARTLVQECKEELITDVLPGIDQRFDLLLRERFRLPSSGRTLLEQILLNQFAFGTMMQEAFV